MMETGKLDPRSNRVNQGAFLAASQARTDGHRRAAWSNRVNQGAFQPRPPAEEGVHRGDGVQTRVL